MIKIHVNGWTKAVLDDTQRETNQKTMFLTFRDRYIVLEQLLTVRKTPPSRP